ncbi:Co-chaperone Hsc20 [Ophiobolus disseminans]|uniref:Co-chaperone Hsc20 n=1 Tax=Ophiobolus disseminans TaxID=1469910 RepID=A0A6A7AFU7_9PLEO|nr:Co-chaperone Hsc20 [Ophiobolus disseminans]
MSPFRTPQVAPPCIFCANLPPPHPQPRRFQSTTTTKEEPFKSPSAPDLAASQTHYSFFPKSLPAGPPPHAPFPIDLSALKREFLQLQARAHPDMHPQSDKKRAEALSARINDAYKTLQHPLSRAQYLLSLRGVEVAEDETAKVDDAELLMEVLEAREAIEDAEREEDLVALREGNEGRIRISEGVLEEAFQRDDVERAKSETVKLRYWVNIKESIDGWERGKPVVLNH